MFRNIKSGACQMTEITKVSNCSQMVYMPQMLKYTVLSLVLSEDMQLHWKKECFRSVQTKSAPVKQLQHIKASNN